MQNGVNGGFVGSLKRGRELGDDRGTVSDGSASNAWVRGEERWGNDGGTVVDGNTGTERVRRGGHKVGLTCRQE